MTSRRTFIKSASLLPLFTAAHARPTKELNALHTRNRKDFQSWDAIGDHRTGTKGDELTAQWINSELGQLGLEPVIDWFDFPRRVLHECCVT